MIVLHWDGGKPIPQGYHPPSYYEREALYHIGLDWSPMVPGAQGGSGLMYHDKLARDGTVYRTREPEDILWHATDANDFSYAICVDCTDGQPPTPAQMRILPRLLDKRRQDLKLVHSAVRGHGELVEYGNQTACPGSSLLNFVREYRAGRV